MIKRNIENGENSSEKVQIFKGKNLIEHFEILINTLNHALVGVTTFYITWYAFTVGFVEYQTFHAWFSTIAYQLFMTEGILALYNNNSITMAIHKKAYKIRIHLVLQIAAFSFALFGISYQIYNRQITGRNHFHNTHGITGYLFICKYLKERPLHYFLFSRTRFGNYFGSLYFIRISSIIFN